jgi:hypothetical protein
LADCVTPAASANPKFPLPDEFDRPTKVKVKVLL